MLLATSNLAPPVRELPRLRSAALLLAPCVVALVSHAPSVRNGFVNWDDPMYLLGNELARDPLAHPPVDVLRSRGIGYPIPATLLLYGAESAAFESSGRFGLDAGGFHAVSLGMHALAVLLLGWVARRLGASALGAAAAAAIFAAHPLGVEPVAWVTGQKDLLAALFGLGAIAIRAGPRGDSAGRSIACAALAVLAMASKPSAVAVPAILLGVDLALQRPIGRRAIALYGALAALALADIGLALAGHESRGVSPTGGFGAASLAVAGWTYALQLGHAVWPHGLVPRYFPPDGAVYGALVFAGAALFAVTAGAAWIAYRRGARTIAFGIGAALVAYLPTSGLLPLPRGPADSYMYLPLALAMVAVARVLGRGFELTSALERIELCAVVLLVVGLGAFASRGKATMWRDSPTLWSELAAVYPNEPRALMRVGDGYLFEEQPDQALLIFDEVEQRWPEFARALPSHADALMLAGRLDDAERKYAEAARRLDARANREAYAFYLIRTPSVDPSDDALAARALRELAPELAERGKRPSSLARAAELLERYGERDLAAALRARRGQVQRRR
jgi:tetratricopeptide (TPR) repeat protein